jgi:hypothetical protein
VLSITSFVADFREKLFLKESPEESGHMGLTKNYSASSSVRMRIDQDIDFRRQAGPECYAESPKQHLLCAAWLHPL